MTPTTATPTSTPTPGATGVLRIVEGAEAARESVLRRDPFGEPALPESVIAGFEELWGEPVDAAEHVRRILAAVAEEGDAAVTRLSQRFDGSEYEAIEVTVDEIVAAFEAVPPEQLDAVKFAIERVRRHHKTQLEHGPRSFSTRGAGMVVRPIAIAGVYMTGSEVALPSSVIHTVIPAAVAGVGEIIGVTPARADGTVHPLKLVAAKLSGVDRVFRASGAQGIAALAFGTETIPRVDKIYGPGGVFVTLAKQQLFGRVGIDALYGPTETLVLADGAAAPDLCAADLIAQAEHDVLATPVLITTSRALAEAVATEVEQQLADLDRAEIARAALARGGAVVAADMDEAIMLANEFAPEHLCLLTEDAEALAERITNAGGLFIGEHSPEVLGDYTAGPSHVMPTGGTARFASPLTVLDFLKVTSTVSCSQEDLVRLGGYTIELARAEGLTGHARSIERRLEGR